MFIIVIPALRYDVSTNVVVHRYEDSEVGESEGEEEGSEEEVPSDEEEEEEEEEPAEEQGKRVPIPCLSPPHIPGHTILQKLQANMKNPQDPPPPRNARQQPPQLKKVRTK